MRILVKPATREDIKQSEAFSFQDTKDVYAVYDSNAITLIGLFRTALEKGNKGRDQLHILELEVMIEGCGFGTEIVNYIFSKYNVEELHGYSLNGARAFWSALGATFHSSGSKGTCQSSIPFTLLREDFNKYYLDCPRLSNISRKPNEPIKTINPFK